MSAIKLSLNLSVIISIAFWLTAGCASDPAAAEASQAAKIAAQKSAIESVFAQHAEITNSEGKAGLVDDGEVGRLKQISVRACPRDFRSAWHDYLDKVEDLHTGVTRAAKAAAGAVSSTSDLSSLVNLGAKNAPYLIDAYNQVDQAWDRLKQAAANDGVVQ